MGGAVTLPPAEGRRAYRHLFAAQVLALLGTGIATVALALLSYDLAGADAGAVFGTALSIKTGAYVLIAPLGAALSARAPRRALLVSTDLVRCAAALAMPFADTVGEIYLLIFLFQAASAVFTPVFRATIPELLPDESEYVDALARARLASELEGMVSPIVAAALLLLVDGPALFFGTAVAFLASAGLILRVVLPPPPRSVRGDARDRVLRGLSIVVATPRLRGLILLAFATGLGSAMVLVNTVVLVEERLGDHDLGTAIGLATYGLGAVAGTLGMPRLRTAMRDRPMMLSGAAVVAAALALAAVTSRARPLLPLWFAIGLGTALAQAPYGVLIRRSAQPEEKPSVYAAHFALTHLCMVAAYPLAGRLGAAAGMTTTFALLGATAAAVTVAAALAWRHEPVVEPEP
jgi:MFS family permease